MALAGRVDGPYGRASMLGKDETKCADICEPPAAGVEGDPPW
jgi:hypothetical protein